MARPAWLRRPSTEVAGISETAVVSEVLDLASVEARVDRWGDMVRAYQAGYPERTRQQHTTSLRRWTKWCLDHGVDPADATRKHIEVWMRHLSEEEGLMDRTILGYCTSIVGVYRLAHADGVIGIDPGAHIRRPRCDRVSRTNSLDVHELAALLDAAKRQEPWVDAMIHILGLNGTRSGETRAIDIEHVGSHGEWMTILLPHRKGGVVSTLSLASETERAVRRAIGERTSGPLLAHGPEHPHAGEPVGRHQFQRRFRELVASVGIERRIIPHSLRHTFVTLSLDAHCDIRDIMASTGHHDPSMIGYYDRARASIERNTTHAVAQHIADAVERAKDNAPESSTEL